VYYLLGEEFDRDPFLLFRLRGSDRATIGERLLAAEEPTPSRAEPVKPVTSEPVPADATAFCAAGPLPADLYGDVRLPPVDAAVPSRLGAIPFWQGTERSLDALVPHYGAAARRGLAVFEAETAGPDAGALAQPLGRNSGTTRERRRG
jgi:uncharacterized Zn finger protein